MSKETLNGNESQTNSWDETMTNVAPSSEIDFNKRKQELEAMKLDIEKAKLEAELKRAQKEADDAGGFLDHKIEAEKRISDARMNAEESAYRDLEFTDPELIADNYEIRAQLDDIDDKMMIREEQMHSHTPRVEQSQQRHLSGNNNNFNLNQSLNDLERRQNSRYSGYQDTAEKHIKNVLDAADRKLDIIDKHRPQSPDAT